MHYFAHDALVLPEILAVKMLAFVRVQGGARFLLLKKLERPNPRVKMLCVAGGQLCYQRIYVI